MPMRHCCKVFDDLCDLNSRLRESEAKNHVMRSGKELLCAVKTTIDEVINWIDDIDEKKAENTSQDVS